MKLGIFDFLSLATTLVFAIPVANFGLTRLLAGDQIAGVALLVVAVAMVVLPQYFFDPTKLVAGLLPSRFTRDSSTATESEESTADK